MMPPKQIVSGGVQADCDVCNLLVVPTKGCAAGAGFQIVIPGDWLSRVMLGQDMPGCTYHHLDATDGSLTVSSQAQLSLTIPALVNALTAPQQLQVTALLAKIATATIETGAG